MSCLLPLGLLVPVLDGDPVAAQAYIQFTINVTVKAELAFALLSAAGVRGRTPASLMAEIVEIVLTDGLVGALLDDGK